MPLQQTQELWWPAALRKKDRDFIVGMFAQYYLDCCDQPCPHAAKLDTLADMEREILRLSTSCRGEHTALIGAIMSLAKQQYGQFTETIGQLERVLAFHSIVCETCRCELANLAQR